jgi:hypothetical protein
VIEVRRTAGVVAWFVAAAAIVDGLVEHPPHGADVVYAAVFLALFVGVTVFGLSRLLPKRPVPQRATLQRRLWAATAAVWAVAVLAVGLEVVTIVVNGGLLPWLLPIPGAIAVRGLLEWRSDLAVPARCLASGDWTPVAAAAFDVRPGEPVDGWAVLPGDVRIKFRLPAVPADIAEELSGRRRLWLAGWPSEHLVVGLPDGESYAVDVRRDRKNTVPGGAGPPVASLAMKTVQQSFPVPPEVLWNALPAGVSAIGGQGPYYESQRGFVSFRTGMSLLSWGQEITATVAPSGGGSTLTVQTNLKFGVFDWGEGKRIAARFSAAVASAAGTAALA